VAAKAQFEAAGLAMDPNEGPEYEKGFGRHPGRTGRGDVHGGVGGAAVSHTYARAGKAGIRRFWTRSWLNVHWEARRTTHRVGFRNAGSGS